MKKSIREALHLCFFMPYPHRKVGPLAWRALQVYRRAVGYPRVRWVTDADSEWLELDAGGWRGIQRRMNDSQATVGSVTLHERPEGPGDYEFRYSGAARHLSQSPFPRLEELSLLECWLPSEYLKRQGPARVRTLALRMAAHLPFSHGYLGLALRIGGATNRDDPEVRHVLTRHPGFTLADDLMTFAQWMGDECASGVYWLNFLGPKLMRRLGGVRALRARLVAPGTTVESLPGRRAVVSLGDSPDPGDLEQRQPLPAYRELARVLEPQLFVLNQRLPEWYNAWEWRFLDPLPWERPASPRAPWRRRRRRSVPTPPSVPVDQVIRSTLDNITWSTLGELARPSVSWEQFRKDLGDDNLRQELTQAAWRALDFIRFNEEVYGLDEYPDKQMAVAALERIRELALSMFLEDAQAVAELKNCASRAREALGLTNLP